MGGNTFTSLLALALLAAGCDGRRVELPDLALLGPDPNDHDADGYTPAQGDCDDNNPAVGPMAVELPGNHIDDDCNGTTDEVIPPCDSGLVGQKDAAQLAATLGLCDARFLTGAVMTGPSDPRARAIVSSFGKFVPLEGGAMMLISTGLAGDDTAAGFILPQPGTELAQSNSTVNPDQTLEAIAGCGSLQPAKVNDYTELTLSLRVPQNVTSMSFHVQFFSSEFPEYVCTSYNDELLVELASKDAGGQPHNISFDAMMNPLTVNNGFFTICQNDTGKPQTQHCTMTVDGLQGTGYDQMLFGNPVGGSTGWLTTTAPVTPRDELTLRFIVFDEGDHIYDSAALIDSFTWSTDVVGAPVTVQ